MGSKKPLCGASGLLKVVFFVIGIKNINDERL